MKIPMGNFQVCDALNIFFELEKPLVEHSKGFILLPREGGELQKFFRTFNQKFILKNLNSPTGPTKASASMVGGMFAVTTMSC
jgi:hypothetical protein